MTDENNCLYEEIELIRVKGQSHTPSIAGAVAGMVRDNGRVNMQAIGAAAVNQAIKAMAMASEFLIDEDIEIVLKPSFTLVEVDGKERTAIFMEVIKR